jgi:twitching motility two-component system response regulator PilG
VQIQSPNDHEVGVAEIETDLVGARVLVIDDSNTIRRSAEIFLRQGGHEVLLAEDGFDALSKISDHDPELIFCDILMPRLDGYQTCAIIKRNPRFAHVPVIMLSSKDGLFDKARGRMVGSQDYLTKPFTKEQLLRAVDDYRRAAFPSEDPSEAHSEAPGSN